MYEFSIYDAMGMAGKFIRFSVIKIATERGEKCYTITSYRYMIPAFYRGVKSKKTKSQTVECIEAFVLHLFEEGRSEPCHFLELIG
jgi:hypothetical protein